MSTSSIATTSSYGPWGPSWGYITDAEQEAYNQKKAAEQAETPTDTVTYSGVQGVVSRAVSMTAGTVGGMVGMITNGCAGGAHGIIKGAGLTDQAASLGFDVAFAANLLATGGVLYGTQSAMSTLFSGVGTWKYQSEMTRQQTRESVEQYLGKALQSLPPVPPGTAPTTGRIVGQAAIGEVVGMAAGAMVGAQGGYIVGSQLGERAFAYTSQKLQAFDKQLTAFLDSKTAETQSVPA